MAKCFDIKIDCLKCHIYENNYNFKWEQQDEESAKSASKIFLFLFFKNVLKWL
jgi:hypothetical protein